MYCTVKTESETLTFRKLSTYHSMHHGDTLTQVGISTVLLGNLVAVGEYVRL